MPLVVLLTSLFWSLPWDYTFLLVPFYPRIRDWYSRQPRPPQWLHGGATEFHRFLIFLENRSRRQPLWLPALELTFGPVVYLVALLDVLRTAFFVLIAQWFIRTPREWVVSVAHAMLVYIPFYIFAGWGFEIVGTLPWALLLPLIPWFWAGCSYYGSALRYRQERPVLYWIGMGSFVALGALELLCWTTGVTVTEYTGWVPAAELALSRAADRLIEFWS